MSTRVYFEEYGDPQVLKVGTEKLAEPGDGLVQVEFRAVSVNPVDWKLVAGYLKRWVPLDFPAVPGCEAAGGSEASIDSSLPTSTLACSQSGFFFSFSSSSRSGGAEITGGGTLSFLVVVFTSNSFGGESLRHMNE